MSSVKALARFEELDAGRVLGDLSAKEISEWQTLATEMENIHSIAVSYTHLTLPTICSV